MNTADVGNVVLKFYSINNAYVQENKILKAMLREWGLSDKQIRKELRKRLKHEKIQETAFETLAKCSQEITDILRRDAEFEGKLRRSHAKIPRRDMD